jgi:high affinity sulfate transporter 1
MTSSAPPAAGSTRIRTRASSLARNVPGIRLLATYERAWLRNDILAGLVLISLLVPQGMAYSQLAGLPPVNGLYTTAACLVGYALVGPSRILVLGPDSAVSPMIRAAIVSVGVAADDPGSAVALAGMLALLVGLMEIALAIGRLAFVADLLSKEVKIGYLNGLAVVIVAGQLPALCGFSVEADEPLAKLHEFFTNLDQTHVLTLVVGVTSLILLAGLPRVLSRIPAILIVIVGATVLSQVLDLDEHGVSTVGSLPQGLPVPTLPWTSLHDLGVLSVAAIGITLVSLADTITTASSFAARRGEEVHADGEMIGLGAANIAAGLFRGFAVSSSASRSAVADAARAQSQVAGLVGAGGLVVVLVFFNSVLSALPDAVLAAVIVSAGISLVDVSTLRWYWTVRRSAVLVAAVASAGVILFGVLLGIVCAIAVSILLFFRRSWWPHGAVLRKLPNGEWHAVADAAEPTADASTATGSGTVVFRWEAPLFFANSRIFRAQIRKLIDHDEVHCVILQCEAITDIDVTGADLLAALNAELAGRDVQLLFVELRSRLIAQLIRAGVFVSSEHQRLHYGSIDEAIQATARATSTAHTDGRRHETALPGGLHPSRREPE